MSQFLTRNGGGRGGEGRGRGAHTVTMPADWKRDTGESCSGENLVASSFFQGLPGIDQTRN